MSGAGKTIRWPAAAAGADVAVAGGFYCDQLGFTETFRAPCPSTSGSPPSRPTSFRAAARSARITGPVHQDEYGHSGPSRNLHANLFACFLY